MTAVGIVAAVAVTLLLARIITPSFTQLEDKAIAGHVERARAALSGYAANMQSAARSFGDWDASYAYIAHPNTRFERENFSPLAMTNTGVHGIAYVTTEGRIVGARWHDTASSAEQLRMRDHLIAVIHRTDITRVIGQHSSGQFYSQVGGSVVAIGVAQVRRSDGSGVTPGYIVMARVITAKQISDLLRLKSTIDLSPSTATKINAPSTSNLAIAVPMIGADGRAVASALFIVPRDVSLLGRRMLLLAVAGSTLLLLLVLIVLRLVIARLVLRPLHRVESHMQRVRVSGSLALVEEHGRRDEIGSLGRSFNGMLRQLKDLREQIEVQSFDLGRSESAVAVMHNVRNALNPISTILSLGVAKPVSIDRATLDRALDELADGNLTEDRRRKLTAFVGAAITAESADREATRRDLVIGREAMAHVLEIIGQQQRAAHERPKLEICDVTDIIARNATIVRYAPGASIAFTFPAGPAMALASRIILSQVIGNLFGNAVESIVSRGLGSGSIIASITEIDGRMTIAIRDDGEGFSPEIAATLFQRGFSTRAHKSGGLGLHWCANSMNTMGGSLRLESDGPGLGAVAILTLQADDRAVTSVTTE